MKWVRIATFLLLGYLSLGRSFAYWGIPPMHIFVGEIALGLFLVSGPRTSRGAWLWVAARNPTLRAFKRAFLLSLGFGVFEMSRGILRGFPPLLAVRDLAINYYPLYFFLGLWAGLRDREYLKNALHAAAWVNGIYGLLFIFLLSRVPWYFPGVSEIVAPVSLFGQPSFSGVILLGLLSFEKDLWRVKVPILLNAAVLVGMLIRAEWVAFAVGLFLWALITKNVKRLLVGGVAVIGIVGIMYVTNFSYAGPKTRGGIISVRDIVGRVLAPIDPSLATDYTSNLQQFEGNALWRTVFWATIWERIRGSAVDSAVGLGYGYPLNELSPDELNDATRTPHNVFFWLLGYTGWIGVFVFGVLQCELARLLWRAYKTTGNAYGILFFVSIFVFAIFTPFFETPQGAIPCFLIAGSACGPVFLRESARVCSRGEPGHVMRPVISRA